MQRTVPALQSVCIQTAVFPDTHVPPYLAQISGIQMATQIHPIMFMVVSIFSLFVLLKLSKLCIY